ncbi:MAG: hypothetical protein D3910_14595 [Candidatus Electrothrix sp. ATG2]|nr:hypothetical protein [Candidatus Electrothrix sp. ATG2]
MAWFHGVNINENITLREGTSCKWNFSLKQTCPVSLYVAQIDGYGIDIYVMTTDEYRNFSRGKAFRYLSGLGYENVGSFENTVNVPAGNYCLVATLGQIREGMDSYAVAAVRCETLE